MIERFLYLYRAIRSSIDISYIISNKNQLRFTSEEIKYLEDIVDIFKIFIKATTKL